jgi:hypothetical protein
LEQEMIVRRPSLKDSLNSEVIQTRVKPKIAAKKRDCICNLELTSGYHLFFVIYLSTLETDKKENRKNLKPVNHALWL